jgi:hypothetical protein
MPGRQENPTWLPGKILDITTNCGYTELATTTLKAESEEERLQLCIAGVRSL